MAKIKHFNGFPEQVSKEIEFPNIAELLLMPAFQKISPDDLWKYGNSFHRELLNNTPFKNNTKYISIICWVQFLWGGMSPIVVKHGGKYEGEWHYDTSVGNATWHICTNDVEGRTEFNTIPFDMDITGINTEKQRDLINTNPEKYGIVGKKIIPFRIHTFDESHLHRGPISREPQFRFFYRVMETNQETLGPRIYPQCLQDSVIYTKQGECLKSICRRKHKIIVNISSK